MHTTLRALPPETHLSERRGPRGTTPPSLPGGIAAAPVRALIDLGAAKPVATGFFGGAKPLNGFAAGAKPASCGDGVAPPVVPPSGAGFCAGVGVFRSGRFASAKPASDAMIYASARRRTSRLDDQCGRASPRSENECRESLCLGQVTRHSRACWQQKRLLEQKRCSCASVSVSIRAMRPAQALDAAVPSSSASSLGSRSLAALRARLPTHPTVATRPR